MACVPPAVDRAPRTERRPRRVDTDDHPEDIIPFVSSCRIARGPERSFGAGWTPRPTVRLRASICNEPIYAAAISSAPDGGYRANWIRNGYQAVHSDMPRIVAVSWLHADLSGPPTLHHDWRLTGRSLDAFAEIAAMTKFQERID